MTSRLTTILLTGFIVALIIALPYTDSQAAPPIELRVTDTAAVPGDTGYLGIYLTNRQDIIAAFELTLIIDRPDLIGLSPSFDSSQTLTSGWEYLSATMTPTGIKLTGVANLIAPAPIVPGISPSPASRLLVKFPFTAHSAPDSIVNRTATLSFAVNINDFGLANSGGQLIGLVQDTTWDTTCFHCANYFDGACVQWVVSTPPCDSISIERIISNPRFDTSYIHLIAGSVTLLPNCRPIPLAGDVSGNAVVDSNDLALLRDYVQFGTPPLAQPLNADLLSDSCINWRDYEVLDRYLRFGPDSVTLAACGFNAPERCCCDGRRGNVNNDRLDVVDLSDLSRLVGYLTGVEIELPCYEKADYTGNGLVDLQDLSKIVSYLTTGSPAPGVCP
ncbi:MAG: dockerin type I domain-containing protein [Candidatus Zixiibacteriota bacterium]